MRFSFGILIILLLVPSACQSLTTVVSTPTPERDRGVANPTATVSKFVETSAVEPAVPAQRVYTVLCYRVTVPADWLVDAATGVYTSSRPAQGPPDFGIVDGTSTPNPTLEIALSDLKRGVLGTRVQSVENWVMDGEPALWATLEPNPQFRYIVMVITPDCGGGRRALFISTGGENRESFESFLKRIRFIK
jgi:hypothetical protein